MALYDAMKGIEYSKNRKKGFTRQALMPVTFGEKPALSPPSVTKDGFVTESEPVQKTAQLDAESEEEKEKKDEKLPFLFSYIPMNMYDMMY